WPVPAAVLPAASIVRTDSVPVPLDSVTPLADQVPLPAVALTQVEPPLVMSWVVSPATSLPLSLRTTFYAALLVMKSPAVPLSALSAVTVAAAVGADSTRVRPWPVPAAVLPAASLVRTDKVPVPLDSVTPLADQVPLPAVALTQVEPSALTWI